MELLQSCTKPSNIFFFFAKCIWKFRLKNSVHVFQSSSCLPTTSPVRHLEPWGRVYAAVSGTFSPPPRPLAPRWWGSAGWAPCHLCGEVKVIQCRSKFICYIHKIKSHMLYSQVHCSTTNNLSMNESWSCVQNHQMTVIFNALHCYLGICQISKRYDHLTHCGPVTPYGNWVNIDSGNGLLPDGTKPSPEPM